LASLIEDDPVYTQQQHNLLPKTLEIETERSMVQESSVDYDKVLFKSEFVSFLYYAVKTKGTYSSSSLKCFSGDNSLKN